MVILSVLRVLLEFMLAVAAIASYNFGSDLLCAIAGLYFWPVKLVGGCASLSAMCFLLEKIKDVGLSTLFQTNFFRLFFRYCTGV